jgi:hypothetical protein
LSTSANRNSENVEIKKRSDAGFEPWTSHDVSKNDNHYTNEEVGPLRCADQDRSEEMTAVASFDV